MKKLLSLKHLLAIVFISSSLSLQAQATMPDKQEFLNFWTKFKNAIKANDANTLFSIMAFPYQSEGGYYNTEADVQDVKDNYKEVLPRYLREMEFVRFDVIMIENAGACIWLGYSYEDKVYFYCYKILEPGGNLESSTYEEKYWFKKVNNTFKLYRTTVGQSGTEY